MNINGLGNKLNVGSQQKAQRENHLKDELFFNRFKENVSNSRKDRYEKSNNELMWAIMGNYEYYSVSTINRIKENGQVEMTAVTEAKVRNISYEESDHVQVNIKEGYTYRSQVNVSGHSVYLEYRDDEGMVKAYVADVPSISKNTENPVEQMALASWNKVMEENRRALGVTDEYHQPIYEGMTVPGKYVNGCFISEMSTYEDTIFLGKFGDACGMAGLFGGSWSDYYPMEKGEGHPDSIEVKLFTGRTVIVDVDRISQISQLKGVLSKAEYAQLEASLEKEAGSIRMPQEKWEQLLRRTDDALKEFKEQIKAMIEEQEEKAEEKRFKKNVPYGELANKDGVIVYKGVVFTCDEEKNAICLGDMSNLDNVLTIPLSNGGCLKVNRANFDDLAKAITMFSAVDRNLIMRAIQQDKKVQQLKQKIEDEKASVGEIGAGNSDVERKQNPQNSQSDGKEQDNKIEQMFELESESDSEIIVKPDGSRVLVVKMKIGGVETSVTMKLSEPDIMNDAGGEETSGGTELFETSRTDNH